jgi:hypothetical protein
MNKMKRGLLAAASTVAVVLGSVLVAPGAQGAAGCHEGVLCAYTKVDIYGTGAYYRTGDADLGDSVGPQGMNNAIESLVNRTDSKWCGYDKAGYQVRLFFVLPQTAVFDLGINRNKITSLKKC